MDPTASKYSVTASASELAVCVCVCVYSLNTASLDGQVTESSTAVTSADVTPTSRSDVQFCNSATVDAATSYSGTAYFFKGLLSSVVIIIIIIV